MSRIVPQRLVIVVPTSGAFDSRAFRIASAAVARGHAVTVLGRAEAGRPSEETTDAGYRVVRVPADAIGGLPLPATLRRRLARRHSASASDGGPSDAPAGPGSAGRLRRAWRSSVRFAAVLLTIRAQSREARRLRVGADLYHGMAYMGIPIALSLGRRDGVPVVYDARDIYVDAGNLARLPRPVRSALARLERRWARAAARVVTVNQPYADVMARRWDVPSPLIIMNCAYRAGAPNGPDPRLRRRLAIGPDRRIVLYQGGFSPDRGIEQLIEAIDSVPDADLALLGYGRLRDTIASLASRSPAAERIHLLPAVPPIELLDWVAGADVVAIPIQPTTLNHRLTTPNKLFEAMAAGVPVVASDLPGMAPIVRETGCGRLVDATDPAALAAALQAILEAPTAEWTAYVQAARAAVEGRYCWEKEVERLFEEYTRLTGRPW